MLVNSPSARIFLCSQGQRVKLERKRYLARLRLEVVKTLPMLTAKPKQETMNLIRHIWDSKNRKPNHAKAHKGRYICFIDEIH